MEMSGKTRRMHYRDGKSLREITRRTGLSRNTVRKWLRDSQDADPPKYVRKKKEGKLGAFQATICQALEADSRRLKQHRRTAKVLLSQIREEGYSGSYSQLTAFIREWKGQAYRGQGAFVPLSFGFGEAFQFDWSEERVLIGGIYSRICVSHLKLCASRAFWVVAYPGQGHEMLFDAHTRSFEALGGIPRRGIYDNMKTAVDKVNKGKSRVVNARFAVMCSHYLFDAEFCNVASGWEKGVVEKHVQDSRRWIWQEAQTRKFGSFAELNSWLGERCKALWQELRHPEYRALSLAEVLEQERSEMMPMPAPFDGYIEKLVRVSGTCLINVHRNRYSVPCELAGQMISARLYPDRIVVVSDDAVIASHERLFEREQVSYDWQHYIPLLQRKPGALRNGAPFADMPDSLMRLRHVLLRREGGERVMAQVLSAIAVSGLEAVLVAVELVLESGAISAEHILNVIARLSAGPMPPCVETSLQLREAPQANTRRYDSLRHPSSVESEVNHA